MARRVFHRVTGQMKPIFYIIVVSSVVITLLTLNVLYLVSFPEHSSLAEALDKLRLLYNKTGGRNLGYLVILGRTPQFTDATRRFLQLYEFSERHWKLGLIEPYVAGSRLWFVPSIGEDIQFLHPFSTYYNRSHLLQTLETCLGHGSSSVCFDQFPNFLLQAAREFIVLKFTDKQDKNISLCNIDLKSIESLLNFHVNKVKDRVIEMHGMNYQFRGIEAVCVRAPTGSGVPFSFEEVGRYVRNLMSISADREGEVVPWLSVVVPEWKYVENQKITKDYYYDPNYKKGKNCRILIFKEPSFLVIDLANQFFDSLNLRRPFVGIHIRTERLVQDWWKTRDFMDKCLHNFSKTLEVVKTRYNVSHNDVVFIHDAGKFGSESFHLNLNWYYACKILSKIQSLQIRNVYFDPAMFTAAQKDKEIASFVEREFLSMADVLVTLGRGGYQDSVVRRFQQKNDARNVYRLC